MLSPSTEQERDVPCSRQGTSGVNATNVLQDRSYSELEPNGGPLFDVLVSDFGLLA